MRLLVASMLLFSLIFSCRDLNTSASYPLTVVDYRCLDDFDNKTDHKTFDLLINDDKLFVAKGEKGIEIYSLNPTNAPIANSITMSKDSTSYYPPATALAYGHNRLFAIDKKSLAVFEPQGSIISLSRLKIEDFNENISLIHVDKDLPYAYLSLQDKGLIIYSINSLKVEYDYTNSIKDVQSIFSTTDSLYVMSKENNGTLKVYRKTFTGSSLRLNKVYTKDNMQDIKILNIKDDKLSFINETNNSVGVLNISSIDGSISTYFSIEHNDSVLSKELKSINDFYYDGFYRVIASNYGLTIIDDNNETFEDLTFHSDKMAIYNDFIISTDDVEENSAKSTRNSSGLRIYKFGDIFVSKNYGKAPLKVQFGIRSLNLNNVSWNFNALEIPAYEKSPEYIFEKHGNYNITSTLTYHSGKTVKEYIPIRVTEDKKIKVNLSTSPLIGNAPFNVRVELTDTDVSLIKIISWDVLRDGNTSLLTNTRVSSLNYTFMDSGNYIVRVNVEDFENNMVEKNISVKVNPSFKPEIVMDLNKTYVSKDINFSLIYKTGDIYNDSTLDINNTLDGNTSDSNSTDMNTSDSNSTSNIDTIGRKITSYKWIFHDGSVSYQKDTVYNYHEVGKYSLSAIIQDEYNLSYEINTTVDISSSRVPNIITATKIAESPIKNIFSLVLENNYNRYISDLTWELPNGSSSKVSTFAYVFNNEGEFKVRSRYTLSDGFKGISEIDIKIDNKVDTNITTSVDYGFAPLRVDFKIAGMAHSGIKSYDIDYDDGNTKKINLNETSFSYTFQEARLYNLKLTAHSNKEHKGVGYKKIYAIDVSLGYYFIEKDLDKIAQNKELQVQFEANITDNTFVKSYQWFYGYENAKSEINESKPTYSYKFNKEYKVQFEITLKNDEKITKEIIVNYPTNKGNIELYQGWNLISNPLELPLVKDCSITMQCVKMSKLEDSSVVWILRDGKWEKNPTTIPSKYGIWVKANKDKTLSFYGNRFSLDINNLPVKSWHLLGNGKDLATNDLSSFKVLYIYDSKATKYIKNPTSIKAGKGFYGIK